MLLALDRDLTRSDISAPGLTVWVRRSLIVLIAAVGFFGSSAATAFADGALRVIDDGTSRQHSKSARRHASSAIGSNTGPTTRSGQFVAIGGQAEQAGKGSNLRITLRPENAAGERASADCIARHSRSCRRGLFGRHDAACRRPIRRRGAARAGRRGRSVPKPAEFRFSKTDRRNSPHCVSHRRRAAALEPQSHLADAVWPVRCGVPLPLGTVTDTSRLAVLEDGQRIPAQITTRATWHVGGSAKWIHVDFRGRYHKVESRPIIVSPCCLPRQPALKTPLKCEQTDDQITVDTGAVRFVVNRHQFKGIETAWVAPKQDGHYDLDHPVVSGSAGPYLVDGRLIRFDAANDKNVHVEIEEQGPGARHDRGQRLVCQPRGSG